MKAFAGALIVATTLATGACVNVEATRLSRLERRAPIAPDEVRIYPTPAAIPARYREIALLEANGDGTWTSDRVFFESMRRKAAKLGANGIVLEPEFHEGPVLRALTTLLDIRTTTYRHATAILVDDPAPR